MRQNRTTLSLFFLLTGMIGLLLACSSSDSPTRPTQQPGNPPGTGTTNTSFLVTLTSSVSQLSLESEEPATISVSVRRRDNNQPPPNGATLSLSTNLGDFGSPNSGTRSTLLQLVNGTAAVQLFPGETAGTAVLQAVIDNSSARLDLQFVGEDIFSAAFLEPNIGNPTGGDVVTLRGQGFRAPVRVEFRVPGPGGIVSTTAQVQSVSPDAVRFVVPSSPVSVGVGSTLNVDVVVTNRAATEEETTQVLSGAFIYSLGGTVFQPAVTSLSPTLGPNEGGTRVRILGDGFLAPVQVLFGTGSVGGFTGVEATVQSVTRNEIVVTTPSATGFGIDNRNTTVAVLVRNTESGFATVAPSAFRYGVDLFISGVSPNQGPWQGGTVVTISGQGFEEPVGVVLAGVGADIISVTGSQLVVSSDPAEIDSCNDVTGDVGVTNIETGASTAGGTWIYRVPEPLIVGFSPSEATVNANGVPSPSTVTINGSNFEEPVRVLIGDVVVNGSTVGPNGTSVTFQLPNFVDFETESCDENGDGTSGERLLPTRVDVQVINLLTTCTDEIQNGFLFVPQDQSCNEAPAVIPPAAAFTFMQRAGTTIVDFTDRSTGNITGHNWNFGGLGSSVNRNPSFDFGSPGTYAVTLTVTGPNGSDTITQQVTVVGP